jgi:hypothetical protein
MIPYFKNEIIIQIQNEVLETYITENISSEVLCSLSPFPFSPSLLVGFSMSMRLLLFVLYRIAIRHPTDPPLFIHNHSIGRGLHTHLFTILVVSPETSSRAIGCSLECCKEKLGVHLRTTCVYMPPPPPPPPSQTTAIPNPCNSLSHLLSYGWMGYSSIL